MPIVWVRSLGTTLAAVVLVAAQLGSVEPPEVRALELVPLTGTEFAFGGRTYGGNLSIEWHQNGVAVVEEVPLDGYLAGIREVPLSWPEETLKAQAVAARTYLAWTLDRGRSADGATYDFDICATTQCQVYAGTGVAKEEAGERWLAAIAATQNEILVFDESPAQALYSSSAGHRTRAVQDVWGGEVQPYLQPVDSPEADASPYESWELTLDVEELEWILAHAGITVDPEVRSIAVDRPAEGTGPSALVIESGLGEVTIPAVTLRAAVNRYGPQLLPGLLPATRPAGGRWPQAFLSYTFDVSFDAATSDRPEGPLPAEDLPPPASVTFVGEGWGHGVGMSQWGAFAMGDQGSDYVEILSHYYGGLEPHADSPAIPPSVRVGLAWGRSEVAVAATGPFRLLVDGKSAGEYGPGEWSLRSTVGGLALVPPPQWGAVVRIVGVRPWPR